MTIVQLGKHGDCVNILPLAFMLSQKLGGRIRWLVGKQWASTLEGASYVDPVVVHYSDDELALALESYHGHQKLVTQAWKNPDRTRVTDSFAKEQWRYVGALDEKGKWPLIFDRRSPEREQELVRKFIRKGMKNVLVGTTSVSTPYPLWPKLLDSLDRELDAVNLVPLDQTKAERLYDLIALYDASDLLITIDTCHAHLAVASQCPVIMLQNNGWMGAPPPPQCVASWRYAELAHDLSPVVEAAKKQLSRKIESVSVVFQTYDMSSERHQRAMATHPKDAIYSKHDYPPTMKEMLQEGLDTGKDVIVFTNDDVTFLSDTLDKIRSHALKFDFGCSRRPRVPVHCGREIFWFKSDWLRAHWGEVPNPYWSVQKPDLIMCRWLRHLRGIPTTLENLNYDFAPVELTAGLIEHEDHPSHWNVDEILRSKEGLFNEWLWEKGV